MNLFLSHRVGHKVMAPYGGHDWRPTHPLLRGRATTIVLKHDPALRGLIERLKEAKNNLNNQKKEFLVPISHLSSIDPNYISGFCNGDGSTSLVTGPNCFNKGFG